MLQEKVIINKIEVPIIKEGGEIYYPISYMGDKVLLKDFKGNQLIKNGYGQYIKQFNIDYGSGVNGSTQLSYCISEEGLKKTLSNSKIGGYTLDQKKAMNNVLEYLGLDLIDIDDRFKKLNIKKELHKHNEYIQDCILAVVDNNHKILWQKCTKCNEYYPCHENFFSVNLHSGKNHKLNTCCKCCSWTKNRSKDIINHPDNELRIIYKKYGLDVYHIYKEHDVMKIYKHWLSLNVKTFPKRINNPQDKLFIIKQLYKDGLFDQYENITVKIIKQVTKINVGNNNFIRVILKDIKGVVSINGVEYIEDIESARKVFFKYLYSKNITSSDQILNLNYDKVFSETHLCGYLRRNGNNILTLVMDLFEDKYPAYKFKTNGLKYWDNKDNRIKALKYLIEEDLKVQLEKVPLYVTLTVLKTHGTSTMYNVCKKYYRCLWEWVNEVYPDKFDERDFNIHVITNNFDSMEEAEIHDILKKEFKNVIYNARNTENTIELDGMIPDWFVFTNDKVWVIEYFGISIKHEIYNQRISDYKEKSLRKIEKYTKLNGYEKIYLYPEDMKNNFEGIYKKLKVIQKS